jgi:CTP:molybdopterin cytidylyltransferase MocA
MTSRRHGQVTGLVLAAGEGRRLGQPKALVTDAGGRTWLARTVGVLEGADVADVTVVVGAQADLVRASAPDGVTLVEASDWAEGMGASLRAGLRALADRRADAVAVVMMLVDTPDIGPDVVRRLVAEVGASSLTRATYAGRPGHPVVIGRGHWAGVIASAAGDRGARDYLAANAAVEIECGDLSNGGDVDTPEALDVWRSRDRNVDR